MKDISACYSMVFVLHRAYERHFRLLFDGFCPSSGLCMKDISACHTMVFVLHRAYERHFRLLFDDFCPSSGL
jgi:hypothetical protein